MADQEVTVPTKPPFFAMWIKMPLGEAILVNFDSCHLLSHQATVQLVAHIVNASNTYIFMTAAAWNKMPLGEAILIILTVAICYAAKPQYSLRSTLAMRPTPIFSRLQQLGES